MWIIGLSSAFSGSTTGVPPSAPPTFINTSSRGIVLREATGREFPAIRNEGKIINKARKKNPQ